MKALFIVPKRGWSHENAAIDLLKQFPYVESVITTHDDLPKDLSVFDIIFSYSWSDTGSLGRLKPFKDKTILILSAGRDIEPDNISLFDKLCLEFPTIGHVWRRSYEFFLKHYPSKNNVMLTHGIDTDRFRPKRSDKPNKKFIVGWAGDPTNKDKRFVLAEQATMAAGMEFRVAANQSYAVMADFYNSIDVLLSTSISEAHPMVVYEAMACGKPVICTRAGDIGDTMISYVNGILISPDANDKDIAKVLNYVSKRPRYLEQLGKAARLTILQRWSWEVIAPTYAPMFPKPAPKPVEPPQPPAPGIDRIKHVVRCVSWGGNFFVGLVKYDLKRYMDFEVIPNKGQEFSEDDIQKMDILYVVSPRCGRDRMFRKIIKSGVHIIWHWIGSDVIDVTREYHENRDQLPEVFQNRSENHHHFAVSTNLCEELQRIGIPAKELNLVSNPTYKLEPLPQKFTVLVYYPPVTPGKWGNLYGQDVVKRLVAARPEYDFILYGLRPTQEPDFQAPNVKFYKWVDGTEPMGEIYKQGTCLLRYNMHDGYPTSIIEAEMMGRQVITNGKFPYTIYVQSEAEILNALDGIKDIKILNVRGSEYYRKNQNKKTFLDAFTKFLRGIDVQKKPV
jgi:glycosyltransferase involved in cell wall biosynthesis